MYDSLHMKHIMIKYKEMTWFSVKSFGSPLRGARFEFLLAPLFFYIQFYLFILLGFLVMSTVRPTDRPNWTWNPSENPKSEIGYPKSKIRNAKSENPK